MSINITIQYKDFPPEVIERIKRDVADILKESCAFTFQKKPLIIETWERDTAENGIKISLSGAYYNGAN